MSAPAKRHVAAEDQANETRERILRVANALLYEHGYSRTSLSAIAEAVGISAPALYWHFASKQVLCFTAVHAELSRFVGAFAPCADAALSPEDRLSMFVRTYVRQKLEQREWLKAPSASGAYGQVRDALDPEYRHELDELQRRVVTTLRDILDTGRDAGRLHFAHTTSTAFAIVTMCEYVFVWVRPDGDMTADQVADHYRDLVLAMVGAHR